MMDSTDLDLPDPKRSDLEQDRIILEYAISQFRSMLLNFEDSENSKEEALKEQDLVMRSLLLYKIEQRNLLLKIIKIYDEEYYKLVKEDAL